MSQASSTHGRNEKCVQSFGQKTPREETTQKTYAYGWADNTRMDLREIGWDGVDWIHLAQDRNKWWGPVNMVMLPEWLLASHE
jgi:hypothetical protein